MFDRVDQMTTRLETTTLAKTLMREGTRIRQGLIRFWSRTPLQVVGRTAGRVACWLQRCWWAALTFAGVPVLVSGRRLLHQARPGMRDGMSQRRLRRHDAVLEHCRPSSILSAGWILSRRPSPVDADAFLLILDAAEHHETRRSGRYPMWHHLGAFLPHLTYAGDVATVAERINALPGALYRSLLTASSWDRLHHHHNPPVPLEMFASFTLDDFRLLSSNQSMLNVHIGAAAFTILRDCGRLFDGHEQTVGSTLPAFERFGVFAGDELSTIDVVMELLEQPLWRASVADMTAAVETATLLGDSLKEVARLRHAGSKLPLADLTSVVSAGVIRH